MKWYAIPPYRVSESWEIHNEKGEFIAVFEDHKECEKVCELWNKQFEEHITLSSDERNELIQELYPQRNETSKNK